MLPDRISSAEIESRAQALYDDRIRSAVEAEHPGEFVVIDAVSGDYEVAEDDLVATRRLLARHPDAPTYGIRIGHVVPYRIGVARTAEKR